MRPEAVETCAAVAVGVVAIMSFCAGWVSRGRAERNIRADYRSLFAACQHAVRANGTEQAPCDGVVQLRHAAQRVPLSPTQSPCAARAVRRSPLADIDTDADRAAAARWVATLAERQGIRDGAAEGCDNEPPADDAFVRALTDEGSDGEVLAELEQATRPGRQWDENLEDAMTLERDAREILEELIQEEPLAADGGDQQLEVHHEGDVFTLVPERQSRSAGPTKLIDLRALREAVAQARGDHAGTR